MEVALRQLVKIMPPPAKPRNRKVDWKRVEECVGLVYPSSFKEFIEAYGGSTWCDHLSPFYTPGKTAADVREFIGSVKQKLTPLVANMYDAKYKKIEIPLYPEKGGLFPFMIDYSSSLYCWRTDDKNPSKWPIVCWFTGQVVIVEKTTISKLLLNWLRGNANILGDVSQLPESKLKLF